MAPNRARRIAKEIADIHNDPQSPVNADPAGDDDDLTHLRGSFRGPPGTPYEDGTYFVDIKIPSEYPLKPPVMRFETKVWHPNVSSQTVGSHLDTLLPLNPRLNFFRVPSVLIHYPVPGPRFSQ